MAVPVIMPRQGQSVESCILTEWFKKPGDQIEKGEILFAYETDKAAFDSEAPESGILLAVFADPGDEVTVLHNIAAIGEKGESYDSLLPEKDTTASPEPVLEEKEEKVKHVQPISTSNDSGSSESYGISPRAQKEAAALQVNTTGIIGSGPKNRIIERDILAKSKLIPKATPLAKSISYEDHIELPGKGSGIQGKVTAHDVKTANGNFIGDGHIDEKLSNIRKIIAENMHASLQNTAQLTLHINADARKIKALRSEFKQKVKADNGPNITINDLVSFATIKALQKHNNLNAHFMDTFLRKFNEVHLGFAVDTPRGLMVPTVRNASHLTIEGLAFKIKELAEMAIEGKIDPELLQGASFTMTNLGAFGIEMFTPVLNPPQVAILGVNTITLQPADLGEGGFGFIPKIGLSLTFDHRAIDGAPAAEFLQTVKNEIENLTLS